MGSFPSDIDAGYSSCRPLGPGLRRQRLFAPLGPGSRPGFLASAGLRYDGVRPDPRQELAPDESYGEPGWQLS